MEQALCSLKDIILMHKQLPSPSVHKLACDLCLGMNYIHLCNVLHMDMNDGNFLVFPDWTVKVTDFGSSKQIGIGNQIGNPNGS